MIFKCSLIIIEIELIMIIVLLSILTISIITICIITLINKNKRIFEAKRLKEKIAMTCNIYRNNLLENNFFADFKVLGSNYNTVEKQNICGFNQYIGIDKEQQKIAFYDASLKLFHIVNFSDLHSFYKIEQIKDKSIHINNSNVLIQDLFVLIKFKTQITFKIRLFNTTSSHRKTEKYNEYLNQTIKLLDELHSIVNNNFDTNNIYETMISNLQSIHNFL